VGEGDAKSTGGSGGLRPPALEKCSQSIKSRNVLVLSELTIANSIWSGTMGMLTASCRGRGTQSPGVLLPRAITGITDILRAWWTTKKPRRSARILF